MGLSKAYKEIFNSKNLHENLSKINGEHKGNELVNEVIAFIEKDKKTYLFHHRAKIIMIGLVFGKQIFQSKS